MFPFIQLNLRSEKYSGGLHFNVLIFIIRCTHFQTDEEMQLINKRGATLLYKDFLVRQWMQWREEREPGAAKLREHGDYV